jgi:hypothetical protein
VELERAARDALFIVLAHPLLIGVPSNPEGDSHERFGPDDL